MGFHQLEKEECPLSIAMSIIGNKWKPIIILVINDRTRRFGHIATVIDTISRKVLTDQLRELMKDEVVIREEFKELPPRVEYKLTAKGLALIPILRQLEEWEMKFSVPSNANSL